MLPVVHRPMIARLVEWLGDAGVTDVVLALGFRPEPFASAFRGDRLGDVRVHYAVEPEPLDTAGAIAFAARHVGIDDTFVVVNGDVITDLDPGALIDAHRSIGTSATIHLTPVEDPSAFGVVEVGDDRIVRRFVEKPAPGETDSTAINAGTYVFEPSVLDLIPAGRRVSVERDTFQRLVAERALGAIVTDDYWIDTGRPELYLRANLDLIRGVRGPAEAGVDPGAEVDPEAIVVECVVGSGARIAAGARLGGSVVLGTAHVEAGAEVTDSIVAGRIGSGAIVRGSVIGADGVVPAGDEVAHARVPSPD
jgi:mannose-1-phosphate guanylyltransferase